MRKTYFKSVQVTPQMRSTSPGEVNFAWTGYLKNGGASYYHLGWSSYTKNIIQYQLHLFTRPVSKYVILLWISLPTSLLYLQETQQINHNLNYNAKSVKKQIFKKTEKKLHKRLFQLIFQLFQLITSVIGFQSLKLTRQDRKVAWVIRLQFHDARTIGWLGENTINIGLSFVVCFL